MIDLLNAVPQLVYTVVEYVIVGGLALMAVYVAWPRPKEPNGDSEPDETSD